MSSAAARALHGTTSKKQRSCARSGRLQRWVRRAGPSFRVAASPRAPPRHGTTRHDGRVAEPHQHAITPARRDVRQNHAPHAITPAYRALIGTTRSTRSRRARRAIRTTGDHTTFAQRAVRTTGERTTSAPRAFSTTGYSGSVCQDTISGTFPCMHDGKELTAGRGR